MSSPNTSGDLLQDLAQALHLLYLSDLHNPGFRSALLRVLETLPESQYSEAEWRAAASYILPSPLCVTQSPREQLLRMLRDA